MRSLFEHISNSKRLQCARQKMLTEHAHTAYFLAHLHTFHRCSHAPHVSRCCSACLIKTCSSTGHHVSDRALSLFALTSSSQSIVSTSCPNSSSPLSWSSSFMRSEPPSIRTPVHTQNEEYCPVAIHNPLTLCEHLSRLLLVGCQHALPKERLVSQIFRWVYMEQLHKLIRCSLSLGLIALRLRASPNEAHWISHSIRSIQYSWRDVAARSRPAQRSNAVTVDLLRPS